jgi:hypothetical protein
MSKVRDIAEHRSDPPASPSILWNIGVVLKRRSGAERKGRLVEVYFEEEWEAETLMELLKNVVERSK